MSSVKAYFGLPKPERTRDHQVERWRPVIFGVRVFHELAKLGMVLCGQALDSRVKLAPSDFEPSLVRRVRDEEEGRIRRCRGVVIDNLCKGRQALCVETDRLVTASFRSMLSEQVQAAAARVLTRLQVGPLFVRVVA